MSKLHTLSPHLYKKEFTPSKQAGAPVSELFPEYNSNIILLQYPYQNISGGTIKTIWI